MDKSHKFQQTKTTEEERKRERETRNPQQFSFPKLSNNHCPLKIYDQDRP